jgi:hypothetical protein
MRASEWSFDRLISPLSAETFENAHSEKAKLHIARQAPGFYQSLFDASAVDEIVRTATRCCLGASASPSRPSSVELLGARDVVRPVPRSGTSDLAELFLAYERGASIRVNEVERFSPRLATLGQEIESRQFCRVSMNLYCSPPHSQALDCHYDLEDVLILQAVGSKEWFVYDRPHPLPLRSLPRFAFEGSRDASASLGRNPSDRDAEATRTGEALTLETGDLLYLPRGFYHRAETREVSSAHLTISLQRPTGLDLLIAAIRQAVDSDGAVRQALPADSLRSEDARRRMSEALSTLLRKLADSLDTDRAVEALLAAFQITQEAVTAGSVVVPPSGGLEGRTIVEHVPGVLGRATVTDNRAVLCFQGRSVWAPNAIIEAFEFIVRVPRFAIEEVPGLNVESQRLLVDRLLDDGFLRRWSGEHVSHPTAALEPQARQRGTATSGASSGENSR